MREFVPINTPFLYQYAPDDCTAIVKISFVVYDVPLLVKPDVLYVIYVILF